MDKVLKVLQLGSASGLYGAERWILSLVKYFDPSKIESLVGTVVDDSSGESPLCEEAKKLGFESVTVQSGGRFSIDSILNLREALRQHKIDIVHSHGYKTDVLALTATIGMKCKIVSTPHGWTQDPDLKLRIYETLDKIVFPFFDAVVPLSEELMSSLKGIPGLLKKLTLIRNGVDIGEIEELKEVSDEISGLKSEGFYIVGYIGRLVHGKGLDILISGLAQITGHKWKLLIVGEGEQEIELRQMVVEKSIQNNVSFLGFRADRLSLLKGFDVFVLPSRSEGIPRCVMEAMAAEVPVVASNIPGCRTLIDGKSTGSLFELDDTVEAAEKIIEVLTDQELSNRYTRNAKLFLEEHYSAERMAREYEFLFSKL